MTPFTAEDIRRFIVDRFADAFRSRNLTAETVSDGYDLLAEGVIDSLGLLELISAVEDRFGIEIDFDQLDPEQMTLVGPFCGHVERFAQAPFE